MFAYTFKNTVYRIYLSFADLFNCDTIFLDTFSLIFIHIFITTVLFP